MKKFLLCISMILSSFNSASAQQSEANAFQFSFTDMEGKAVSLEQFKGKPILVVNTASQCGFKGQLGDLQKLHEKYSEKGLVILAVPSNDFGNQEFKESDKAESFAKEHFKITYPMMQQEHVTGSKAHPFYAWANGKVGILGSPKWNYHKYLIGVDGNVLEWFSTKTNPNSESVTKLIEAELAKTSS